MKGIILEKENGKIVVLTKDGKFVSRKTNTKKDIGDEIKITSIEYKQVISIAAALILVFTITFGSYVAYAQPYGYAQVEGDIGVELTYNRQYKVIKINSINESEEEFIKDIEKELKGKKVLGLRFRPQHPIDIFIADFYCHPVKLVIEIDGGIHNSIEQKEYDIGREAELNEWGIKVIRFTNEEVGNNIDLVIKKIKKECSMRLPQTPKGA